MGRDRILDQHLELDRPVRLPQLGSGLKLRHSGKGLARSLGGDDYLHHCRGGGTWAESA